MIPAPLPDLAAWLTTAHQFVAFAGAAVFALVGLVILLLWVPGYNDYNKTGYKRNQARAFIRLGLISVLLSMLSAVLGLWLWAIIWVVVLWQALWLILRAMAIMLED